VAKRSIDQSPPDAKIVVTEGLPAVTAETEPNVIDFRGADAEQKRQTLARAQRLAGLPEAEWLMYYEADARQSGIPTAQMKGLVQALIKAREKKQKEERAVVVRAEKKTRADRKDTEKKKRQDRLDAEKKERAERAEAEKKERAERKDAEKKAKERDKALAAIVKLPKTAHEAELKRLAKRLGEDLEDLRVDFDLLLVVEAEKISRGIVEPWDEPVNTRELLDAAEVQFAKYVIVHDKIGAPIVPLWIAFTWIHDIATFSPLLIFDGADAGMAKSAASDIVSRLTPRGFMVVKPTGPSLFRFVDRHHPTLCIDDADNLLAEDRDLATIIRASWKRGTLVPRVVNKEVYLFDPFGPRCVNGIDILSHFDTQTRTRCITIRMLPKLESERDVTSLRATDADENFVTLRRKFLRWANDNIEALRAAMPKMPEGFYSRLEENYHLLFAVADLAGGDWPKRARAAAVKLSREHNEPSLQRRLLAIFYALSARKGPLLTSKELEKLVPAEDEEFANYKGHSINRYEIAVLMKKYGIRPAIIHPRGKAADRGYDTRRPEFVTAFKHYLGKDPPEGRTVVRQQKRKRTARRRKRRTTVRPRRG